MAPETVHVLFNSETISIGFLSQTSDYGVLSVEIPCMSSEWQLSSLEQICTSSLPPLPHWKTSTFPKIDIGDHVGKTMLKTRYGWILYVLLLL